MKLLIGLGNPEKRYDNTYHNIGFMVMDKLAKKCEFKFSKTYCHASVGEFYLNDTKILVAKPKTYMTLSGASAQSFKNKFKLNTNYTN